MILSLSLPVVQGRPSWPFPGHGWVGGRFQAQVSTFARMVLGWGEWNACATVRGTIVKCRGCSCRGQGLSAMSPDDDFDFDS